MRPTHVIRGSSPKVIWPPRRARPRPSCGTCRCEMAGNGGRCAPGGKKAARATSAIRGAFVQLHLLISSPNSPFPYYGNLNTNVPSGAEYIQTFQKAYHQSTLASTVSAYNFTTPTAVPSATVSGAEGVGSLFEFGSSSVQTTAYNQLIAQVRQDHQTAARAAIAGSGTAPDLHAGYTFALNDQTGAGLGNSYLVTSIHHAGFVRVRMESPVFYGNQFRAIPLPSTTGRRWQHPKPQAQPCIAVVTGPSGQEIYVDQYSRVKCNSNGTDTAPTMTPRVLRFAWPAPSPGPTVAV